MDKNMVVVEWLDAVDRSKTNLARAINDGLSLAEDMGLLVYQDDKIVVLCHHHDKDIASEKDDDNDDFTIIPKSIITKITVYKKKERKTGKS